MLLIEGQTSGRNMFKLLLKGIVAVSDASFPTEGSGKDPKWKTSSFLKWNPTEKTLENYIPEKWSFLWMNGFRDGVEVSRNGNYAVVTREWISGRESGVLLYDSRGAPKEVRDNDFLTKSIVPDDSGLP